MKSEGEISDVGNFVVRKPDGEILQEKPVGKKLDGKKVT